MQTSHRQGYEGQLYKFDVVMQTFLPIEFAPCEVNEDMMVVFYSVFHSEVLVWTNMQPTDSTFNTKVQLLSWRYMSLYESYSWNSLKHPSVYRAHLERALNAFGEFVSDIKEL